jgi:hypothetical protein
MFASTAASIRRAVEGHSNVGWLRPPRFVHAALPLEPYSWAEAMGRWLLTELERFSLARTAHRAAAAAVRAGDAPPQPQPRHGAFVLCSTLAERSCFIVVTSKVCGAMQAAGNLLSCCIAWGMGFSCGFMLLPVHRAPN